MDGITESRESVGTNRRRRWRARWPAGCRGTGDDGKIIQSRALEYVSI